MDWSILISAGALGISALALAKVTSLKSLDLRIETKCAEDEFELAVDRLDSISKEAEKSRPRVASAIGSLQSGMMVRWKQNIENREKRAAALRGQFAVRQLNYDSMSPKKLEEALVELRRLIGRAKDIIGEYERDLAWDDEQRRQIRKDIRANPPSRKSSFDS